MVKRYAELVCNELEVEIKSSTITTLKTIQSIAGAKLLQNEGEVDAVLVFCKASLKYQWLKDGVEKFTNDQGIVIDGTKKQREKQYKEAHNNDYRYIIVNYELLLHDFDQLQDLIKNRNIHLAICDEAHKVTNRTGKMNNALMALVQPHKKEQYPGIDYVFYLTATPLSSKIEQMFGLFQIRRPDFFGKFTAFMRKHLKYSFNGRVQELVGYKNLDELREKVFPYMLRRTDEEIDMELPDITELHHKVDPTPFQKKLDALAQAEQDKINEQVAALYRRKAPKEQIENLEGTLKAMMYVRKAISDTPELLSFSKSAMIQEKFGREVTSHREGKKSPKLEELKDLINEMVVEGGEKLIIFSEFETMVQILRREIEKLGIHCVTYTGKDNTKQKHEKVTEFKENPDCKIFLATDAGAEGWIKGLALIP